MFRQFNQLFDLTVLLHNPVIWFALAFQLWMLIDAVRREEWIWAASIFFFSVFSAILYFFQVYRPSGGGGRMRGFELPGAQARRRIRELQTRIYHLDKARDHLDLADVYFSQGRLSKAESSYRASLERDPNDPDTVAHLGQCLLRLGRAVEAEPLLARVVSHDPRHDYGHTLMALAEAQMALEKPDLAIQTWAKVLVHNSYARAKVQYAELLSKSGRKDQARSELNEVIADDLHAPKFQRSRDRVWVRRAKSLLASL